MEPTTATVSASTVTAVPANAVVPTQHAAASTPQGNPEPAPSASTSRKGIKKVKAFTTQSSSGGIPPLLNVVADKPAGIIQRPEPNIMFPSAINFFQAVSVLDQKMVTTKKFTETSDSWFPAITWYYACLVWTIQVFRTYNVSRVPDMNAIEFLEYIETTISLSQLPVPGAWVPYLQSLTVVEAHHESYGNIHPVFPLVHSLNPVLTAANDYSFPNDIRRLIPNPLLVLDQIIAFAHFTSTAANPYFVFWRSVFENPISATNRAALTLLSPVCSSWSAMARQRETTVLEYWTDNRSRLPTRLRAQPVGGNAPTGDVTDYFQMFGFRNLNGTDSSSFFASVLQDMATYSTFCKGSVPLSSIPIVGIGATIPRMYMNSTTPVRDFIYPSVANIRNNRHAQGHRLFPTSVTFDLRHGDLTLEPIAEQLAELTCVNMDLSRLTVQNGLPAVNEANIREGPFWSITAMKDAKYVNPIMGLQTDIPVFYHSTTPLATR